MATRDRDVPVDRLSGVPFQCDMRYRGSNGSPDSVTGHLQFPAGSGGKFVFYQGVRICK